MLLIALAMILALVLAGLVLVFAAWPARGRRFPARVPGSRWLDRIMASVALLDPALRPEDQSDVDADQEALILVK